VYCAVAGMPILVRDDAAYLTQWIDDLDLLVRAKGQWTDPSQAPRVFAELAAARSWYEERAFGGIADAGGAPRDVSPRFACWNSPNPFNGGTVIGFDVGQSAPRADLAIYDVSGRLVRRFVGARLVAGTCRIEWDGRDERGNDAPSGMYFARIAVEGRTLSRKMVIIR